MRQKPRIRIDRNQACRKVRPYVANELQRAPPSAEESVITEPVIINFVVALGIGLLIGVERERRKGEGPVRSPAGIRTFAVTSLVGAVSFAVGAELLLAVATVGVIALTALPSGLIPMSWSASRALTQRRPEPSIAMSSGDTLKR